MVEAQEWLYLSLFRSKEEVLAEFLHLYLSSLTIRANEIMRVMTRGDMFAPDSCIPLA